MRPTKALELNLQFDSETVFDGKGGELKTRNERIARLRKEGKCVRCLKHHSSKTNVCAACSKSHKLWRIARDERLKRERKCVKCGRDWAGRTKHCDHCKDNRKRWKGLSKRDHCCRCASPISGKFRICGSCREKIRRQARERRILMIKEGRCAACGTKKENRILSCEICALKSQARKWLGDFRRWTELKDLLQSQNHQCAYTGETLVVGSNAAVDHRLPRSRGGSGEINNLQWVTISVNASKWNLTHEEFVIICHKVAERNPKPNPSILPPATQGRPRGFAIRKAASESGTSPVSPDPLKP